MWNTGINASYKILLMGGIGNQLFQVARAIDLSERSIGVQLIYIGEKLDWLYRLGGHTKHDNWLDLGVLADSLGLEYRSITLLELLSLGLKFIARKLGVMIAFDEALESRLDPKSLSSNSWDVGYFQSPMHVSFLSINKVSVGIIKLLGINECAARSRIAFHIRGGDFAINDRLTADQVKRAVERAGLGASDVFVATNDPEFAASLFQSLDVNANISRLSARGDFIAIATSDRVFVSNSSFAFWAALCSKNLFRSPVYSLDTWPYADLLSTFYIDDMVN